ncbi:hypothetical protein [Microvirga sp. M2]|uniref:hypothetical protein n=1 Tax=Microvirga sp. M2 TaxID=3073270 RepID=UPI0039C30222
MQVTFMQVTFMRCQSMRSALRFICCTVFIVLDLPLAPPLAYRAENRVHYSRPMLWDEAFLSLLFGDPAEGTPQDRARVQAIRPASHAIRIN